MNKLDDMKEGWRNNTEQAIATIDKYLHVDKDYEQDFKKLANWLVDTPLNHYGFMTHDEAYAIDNAIHFASLLGRIHHAMVDDGDICFVTIEGKKALMLFAHPQDEHFPTLLDNSLATLNESLKTSYQFSKVITDNIKDVEKKDKYIKALDTMPKSLKDLTITTHTSVDRFIDEIEEIEKKSIERTAKLEEIRNNAFNVNKPKMK